MLNSIAVTGATGFVGSFLLPALRQCAIPRRLLSRSAVVAHHAPDEQLVPGDLLDPASLLRLVEGAEVVLHLGGYAHATSKPDPVEIAKHRRINLEGTQNLFRSAVHAGVRRFVYVSSVKAGGEHPADCLDENSTGLPPDGYGAIKRHAEDWLFEQGAKYGVEVCVLRPTLVYGPGVKGNLAAMLRAIDRGRFPPVPDTGNRRSMVAVQDLVVALLTAAERPEAAGKICILSDDQAYSTRRIYLAMAEALGRRVPDWSLSAGSLRALGRIGDVSERLLRRTLPFNSTLATRLLDSACYRSVNAASALGFEPRYRLEDALPDMVRVYRGGPIPVQTSIRKED
ncbi:MAG: NAD-dependent epimerase/dehydratase family protein [Thiohalobacteraceae bacterium]